MQKQKQVDPKAAKFWDKKDLVRVRMVDTGVETVVCRGYQQAYANEGCVYLGDYEGEPKPEPAKPAAKPAATKKEADPKE